MKTYKITYSQTFNDETIEDSYTKTVNDKRELYEAEANLMSDPHVNWVTWEEQQ